ncbi:MAG: FG-GAP-like repeat-containing protein, partial [Candidatus Thorarchaeota archaeon]
MKSDKMIQTSATGILLVAAIFAISMTLAVPHDVSAQMCGDFNGDDKIDIGDVTGILYYLYDGDIPPVSADSADIDSIAGITNHDLQFLINYLFLLQGAPYCPPYPPDSILPITQDTLEIRNSAVPPDSSRARVELWLKSQDDLLAMSLPFQYACTTSAVFLDSISFVGSAYQGYSLEGDTIYPGESMGAFGITSTTQLSVDYGLLASLWFSITPSADTQYILIDTTTTPPGNITIFSRMTVNTGNKLIAFIPTIVGLGARTVQSVTPGQNELGVAVSTDIEVRFWYDMDDATITDTTFVAYGSVSGPHDGVISYDAPSRTATLTPAVDFRPGEEVTVILSTGIHYQSGLPIDSGFVWSFRTAVGGGSGIYDSYMSSTVGSGLMAVCACDIEGDGDNDLVFAGAGDSVIVLRNEGDGIFQPPAAYGTGVSPGFVVTADLDRDGDMDAVTANYTGASVSVLKNDGTGSFESPDDISVAAACYVVTVDDFDGDGDIDIAASTGAGNVAIIKNNGDATFEPSQYYSSGGTTLHG